MIDQTLIFKQIIFRRPCTENLSLLLREVADFLDASPDIEPMIQDIIISEYVSEPTPETEPDCLQLHEAKLFVGVGREFDEVKIREIR